MKKDTRKQCHQIPWHNDDECHSMQSLVVELKSSKLDPSLNSNLETNKRKRIIDEKPNVTIPTTKIQPHKPYESKEGECIFLS